MPSSWTSSLRFELQATGENLNTWGVRLNTALTHIERAVAGRASIALTGTTYVLSTSNTLDDEARRAILDFTGVGGCLVIIPGQTKVYTVRNGSNGVVTLSTGSGLTVALDPDDITTVYCDGVNVRVIGASGQSFKGYAASAALTSTGTLPGTTGHEGKVLSVVSGAWAPKLLTTADLADKNTAITGLAVAFATAL
jgi:hypothetical protein